MIGIIVAMEKEAKDFLKNLQNIKETKIHHITFYEGTLGNLDIVLTISGIGKVSSSMIVSIMIDHYQNIEKVINLGVSGGYGDLVKCGDVVVGTKYSYADADCSCFENHIFGQIPYLPLFYTGDNDLISKIESNVVFGTILTGDKFFADKNDCDEIVKNHFANDNVCAFDMESTAIAQACYLLNVPFLAIRAISDVIGGSEDAEKRYFDYVAIACKKASDTLYYILNSLQ